MSRIDDAMKRHAGDHSPSPRVTGEPTARAESAAVVLDDYQPETAAELTPAPVVIAPERDDAGLDSRFVASSLLSSKLPVINGAAPDVMALAVEQYRRLAAECHEAQVERGLRKALVTSALPREGKTLTVTNLAL